MKTKLYVVDDFKPYLELLLDFLEKTYPDIEITGLNNSMAALDIILKNRPQILLIDHGMPDRDGSELIKLVYDNYRPYSILISGMSIMLECTKHFDYFIYKHPNFLMTTDEIKSIVDIILKKLVYRQENAIDKVFMNYGLSGKPGTLLFLKQVIRIAKKLIPINKSKKIKKLGLYKAINNEISRNNKFIQYHLGNLREENIDLFPSHDNIDMVTEIVQEVRKYEEYIEMENEE